MAAIFTAIPRNEDALAGGNKILLIGRFSVLNPSCLTPDASGYFTFIDGAEDEFVKVIPRNQTLKTDDNAILSNEFGTVAWEPMVSFTLAHRSLVKRNELVLMAKNEVIIVVVDTEGTGRAFGATNGLKLSTQTTSSGAAWSGELNGYTLEFKGVSKEPAPYVDADHLATLYTC